MLFSRKPSTGQQVKEEQFDRLIRQTTDLMKVLEARAAPTPEVQPVAPKRVQADTKPSQELIHNRERLASLEALAMELKASLDDLSSKEEENARELAEMRNAAERWAACAADSVSESSRLKQLLKDAEAVAGEAVERCNTMQAQHEREMQALTAELKSRAEMIGNLTEERNLAVTRDRDISTIHRKLADAEKMIGLLDASLKKRRIEVVPDLVSPPRTEQFTELSRFELRQRAAG